jgi:hypothetical protein
MLLIASISRLHVLDYAWHSSPVIGRIAERGYAKNRWAYKRFY